MAHDTCYQLIIVLLALATTAAVTDIGSTSGPESATLPTDCSRKLRSVDLTTCNRRHDSVIEPYQNWASVPDFALCCAAQALRTCFDNGVTSCCGQLSKAQLDKAFRDRALKSVYEATELADCDNKKYYDYETSPLCWSFPAQILVIVTCGLVISGCCLSVCVCIIARWWRRKRTNNIRRSAALPTWSNDSDNGEVRVALRKYEVQTQIAELQDEGSSDVYPAPLLPQYLNTLV